MAANVHSATAAFDAPDDHVPDLTSRIDAVPLIDLRGVSRTFVTDGGVEVRPLREIDLTIYPGEFVAIMGQSGSGKSITARSILGLVRHPGRMTARKMMLAGTDLLSLDPKGWRDVRGRKVGMILQDPKFSLNPVKRIGGQIEETLRLHGTGRSGAGLKGEQPCL